MSLLGDLFTGYANYEVMQKVLDMIEGLGRRSDRNARHC